MKKVSFLRAFTALLMVCLLICSTALAAPRYPEKNGIATDGALLLSAETLRDWAKLADRVEDETDVELYLATVDFLDGETMQRYGEGLREKWNLGSRDLLLVMAAGEDSFGFFGGKKVNERFSATAQEKLLSTSFQQKFLAQDYDGALAELAPALARELGKAYDEEIDVAGIFGQSSTPSIETTAEEWLERQMARVTSAPRTESLGERLTEEDQHSGISFGKVLLTIFLLMVIFGGDKRRGRRGCGCGCAPFSSILAGLGLWKLWGGNGRK